LKLGLRLPDGGCGGCGTERHRGGAEMHKGFILERG